jgi:four helix bundle protein
MSEFFVIPTAKPRATRATKRESQVVCVSARGTRVSLVGSMTKQFTHSISCQLSLQLVSALRPAIERIARRDSDLAKQLTRAATSVARNVAEGRARVGADRAHLLRVALGSLREVSTCLDIALDFGWIGDPVAVELLDRLGALL